MISVILMIFFGLVAYSYTQIDVSLSRVSSVEVELEELTLTNLMKLTFDALSGNWIAAALDVVAGVNVGLDFELSNNGLLPVYVPEIYYELYINDIAVGNGYNEINTMINPGEQEQIGLLQKFQKNELTPAIESIITKEGIMEIHLSGTAYFELLGQKIPMPFESSRQISLVDEIQNQLSEIQN